MEAQYELLKQFIKCVKANANILHDPKLEFFREYLESMGATIPPQVEKKAEAEEPPKAEEPEEEEISVPYPEIDNSGVIEADVAENLPMGQVGKEPSDEDLEQANDARDRAMAAFNSGDYEQAVKEYTTAITLNPGSAMMHAKRANALLKLNKPVTAIADCDKAIQINPDSAQGYKFRGRANRLLGKWVEAHTDLAIACKLDYDDVANEWLKETDTNAKKLLEYNRAVERAREEKELRERRERVRRAQEANKKAAEEAAGWEEEGADMPGGGMFDDSEMGELFEDPAVAAALQDIMANPQNIMKHMGNPKVAKALAKMQGMFGGKMPGFGGFPGAGGPPTGGCADSGCSDSGCGSGAKPAPPKPQKAPEPDLD